MPIYIIIVTCSGHFKWSASVGFARRTGVVRVMEYTGKKKRFAVCCVCGKQVSDRKKRILLFGKGALAPSVRDSLTFYLKKVRNEDIADTRLKSLFEKDHMCLNCANIIVKFKNLTEEWRAIVEFLGRHIPSRKSGTLPSSTQPKQPGYANCRLEPTPSTSTYAGPAPSLYPNDHDPPPTAPTDMPHSQSSYDELSEADMMRNSPLELVTNMAQAAGGHLTHTGCPPLLQNANSGSAHTTTGGPGSIPGGQKSVVNPVHIGPPIPNGVPGAARSGQSRQPQPAAQVADQQGGDPTLSFQDDVHDLKNELLNNADRSSCATLLPSTTAATSQSSLVTKMVPEPASVPLVSAATHTLCLCRVTAVKCLLERLAL